MHGVVGILMEVPGKISIGCSLNCLLVLPPNAHLFTCAAYILVNARIWAEGQAVSNSEFTLRTLLGRTAQAFHTFKFILDGTRLQ
jgi:hypothetical protein